MAYLTFDFWVSSMNAPVMVELEGETDPLEVSFFKSIRGWLELFCSFSLIVELIPSLFKI